ncbi:MAG: hypothetical protein ABIK65_14295 [Candidatus Eisenbacteria bacterium]
MPRQNHRLIRTGPPRIALFFVTLLLLSAAAVAGASPPGAISFQALLDSTGTPLAGAHDLTFTIYDSSAAGAALWTETHPGVVVDEGVASVLLGSISSLAGVSFEDLRWLGISVDAGPELDPRTALAGTPYAFLSGDVAGGYAKSLNGLQGDVRIVAGPNMTVTEGGDSIVVSSSGAESDGDWMISGDDLSSVPSGNVGIGTAGPGAKLDVQGTAAGGLGFRVNDDLYVNGVTGFVGIGRTTPVTGAEVFGVQSPATSGYGGMYVQTAGASGLPFYGYSAGGATIAWHYLDGVTGNLNFYNGGVRLSIGSGGNVGIGTTTPLEELDVAGNIAATAETRIGKQPSTSSIYSAFWRNGYEYALLAGSNNVLLNAPAGGTLYERVGNSTKLWLTDNTGDASANFLFGAISKTEIADEPGLASASDGTSLITLTGSGPDVLLSRTIDVPSSGYVIVSGTAQATITHTAGTTSWGNFGVTEDTLLIPNHQDVGLQLPSSAASGGYAFPVTVHDVYSVGAGSHTFYFFGEEGSGVLYAYDMQLTTLFVPSAYGSVTLADGGGSGARDEEARARGPRTVSEIDEEKTESAAFHRDRMAAEVAEIRDRLAALEAELELEED